MPELRRLVDWKAGYSSISVISIVPLLSLLPFAAVLLYTRARAFDRGLMVCAWMWTGGFVFSFAVGIANGDKFAAMYAFGGFIVPVLFGLWLASVDAPAAVLCDKISAFLLILATPIVIYGAFQFAAPPVWDRAWMEHAGIASIGLPQPFLLRPFSTLNAPGPFADFLVAVLLLNLPRLGRLKPLQIGALTLMIGVLALTSVRSAWIAFAIGVLAYVLMSPRRARNIMIFGGIAVLCALLLFNASDLLGSAQAGNNLAERFNTFTNIASDRSYMDRQQYLGATLQEALEQPLGLGLGAVGTATKLTTGGTVDFDNGYVARLVEMGYLGMLCYLATLVAALFLTFRYWRRSTRMGLHGDAAIAAALFAVQLALASLDISSDHHSNFSGLFFWMTLALACRWRGAGAFVSSSAQAGSRGRAR